MSCMSDRPDSPGRALRMSAPGLTSVIPKAFRSWGVATYTGPDQDRPAAACCSEALVWSSSMTVPEPRALAMFRATAACACGVLFVWVLDPPGPLPGPWSWPGPLLAVYTMIWLLVRFGPA